MHPFTQEKRRKINLGGATSVASQTEILHSAKARRSEREEIRRRHESALCIQSHWRSFQKYRAVRQQLSRIFQEDVLGLNGMRALVLVGSDGLLLAQWSEAVVRVGDGWSLQYVNGPDLSHWIVLVRQLSILLLRSVANSPRYCHRLIQHLRVLDSLLSPTSSARSLGERSEDLCTNITLYVMRRGLYPLLAKALNDIPAEDKNLPSIPLLVPLLTYPLRTFNPSHPESFLDAYTLLIQHVLSLPLLPNRLPLASLTHLSANLPLAAASVLSPSIPQLATALGVEAKVHIIANLAAFVPPRYPSLPPASLTALLHLMASIMGTLPTGALEPPSSTSNGKHVAITESDSDSDSEELTRASVSVSTRVPTPRLDERTLKRLQTLPTTAHISSLIRATQSHTSTRVALCDFFFALCTVWPSRADTVLSTVVVSTGGGLVRELYRGYVRSSPLGGDDSFATLLGTRRPCKFLASFTFLTDLYTHSLLTMGDDEFFSGFSEPTRANAPRNPLTLDEITSLSRKFLNIAFTLFWREEQIGTQDAQVPGLSIKWDGVRRKLTRFLQAVHTRDSRRPFTPSGHWLVNERIDIDSFVEVAVGEEEQFVPPVPGPSRRVSKRSLAFLSPRLGVLNNIPFAIPFEARVNIFRSFVVNDKRNFRPDIRSFEEFRSRTHATVRRGHVAEDGFDKLADANLKRPIGITFIDQFGEEEMGIDGGGVFKEFLTDLSKEVFDSNRGLWLVNKTNELYPSHGSYATEPHSLNWYRFIGRILGKALYEGILVDVAFAGFFLAKWLGKQSFLDDLASLDPDLYQGLIFLKHYPGNPEDLSLNFTIADEEFGVARTIDLKPNGSNIPVTRDNKLEYILRVSHYRLTKQIKQQSDAFFEGLMFNQQELQVLLGGVNTPIDLDDLRRNTNYGGLYGPDEPTILAFWKVVEGFDAEQRRALLRFVTSVGAPAPSVRTPFHLPYRSHTDCPSLCSCLFFNRGFSGLVPKFCIRDAGGDENRLPTSSTCVNLLKVHAVPGVDRVS
ncbi:HECT-domain-containing protein [Lactarius hatsudake]|nr:HECT-domain-containing protein [Lactarius hatsudake]